DPRGYALLAFGGAGPLHAAAVAEELEIKTIICPRASGVLAALGLIVSPRRRDAQRSVFLAGDMLTSEMVADAVSELGQLARSALDHSGAELSATYELRYQGQAFELPIKAGVDARPDELRQAFEREHEHRYGYSDPEQVLELVTIRVSAAVPAAEISFVQPGHDRGGPTGHRTAILDGAEVELQVFTGHPPPGTQ